MIVLGTQTVNFVRFPLADILCSDDIVLFIGTHFNLSKKKLSTALVQIIQQTSIFNLHFTIKTEYKETRHLRDTANQI